MRRILKLLVAQYSREAVICGTICRMNLAFRPRLPRSNNGKSSEISIDPVAGRLLRVCDPRSALN